MRRTLSLALAGLLTLGMTACDARAFEAFLSLFDVVRLAESADPEVNVLPERIAEDANDETAARAYSDFGETGDPEDLQQAIRLQPDNPRYRAAAFALAALDADEESEEFRQAKQGLLLAQAKHEKKHSSILRPELTAEELEREASNSIWEAQAVLLGGLYPDYVQEPPGDDRGRKLFRQYCENGRRLGVSDPVCPAAP